MGLDKVAARRLADEHLARWRASTTYAELAHRDEHSSSDESEVTDGGVTYRVVRTVWRESGDRAYTMSVKVTEAQRRGLFRSSVLRTGRMHPDGSYTDEV
jgi:hypothetical protein